jgi:hypothetical protein
MRKLPSSLLAAFLGLALLALSTDAIRAEEPPASGWKAGTAKVVITPRQSMWMAGYGSRTKPSEGKVHDLWAKALAFQDPTGKRGLLLTMDVCGIGRTLSNSIRDALKETHGLERSQIILSCSHTHCGPVVGDNLISMYKLDDEQRQRITEYADFLRTAVLEIAERALAGMADAEIGWESGRCDFAVNRRENKEADVPELRKAIALRGPVDHDVPVLRVRDRAGALQAIVFGYACHCTVLSFDQFCGDYAGFAQIALERNHPGAQAMFVAGCGADQNPLPRRSVELAEGYGEQLARSVDAVLVTPMRPVSGAMRTSYEEIDLAFATLPSQSQIESDAKSTDFCIASRAKALLKTIETDGSLAPSYPYPVQIWKLGDLDWFLLGGEVVVDYSLRIKRNLGSSHTWVSGYCNDVMAYIPSLRVLKEGGYEGATSMIYYGRPTSWSEAIEDDIIAAVRRAHEAVSAPAR